MVEGTEIYPRFENGKDWNSPQTDYVTMESGFHFNWWGGNFRGVKDYPIDLGEHQAQLVYSPHDYGPSVWEQDWFKIDFNKETLHRDCWQPNWAFIHEQNITPLLIGEWGGFVIGDLDERGASEPEKTAKNTVWLEALREYIIENRLHHTWWCFNYNSSDTGGLMYDDFQKWNTTKYEFLKPALWQTDDGKFIGLDHEIPLGKNGITLTDYFEDGPVKPEGPVTPADGWKWGDADCNDTVEIADAVRIAKIIIGAETLADFSEDTTGFVQSHAYSKLEDLSDPTVKDLLNVILFITGKITEI
jgi:hypothetical protein